MSRNRIDCDEEHEEVPHCLFEHLFVSSSLTVRDEPRRAAQDVWPRNSRRHSS